MLRLSSYQTRMCIMIICVPLASRYSWKVPCGQSKKCLFAISPSYWWYLCTLLAGRICWGKCTVSMFYFGAISAQPSAQTPRWKPLGVQPLPQNKNMFQTILISFQSVNHSFLVFEATELLETMCIWECGPRRAFSFFSLRRNHISMQKSMPPHPSSSISIRRKELQDLHVTEVSKLSCRAEIHGRFSLLCPTQSIWHDQYWDGQ